MPDREDYTSGQDGAAADVEAIADRFTGFDSLAARPRSARRVTGFAGEVAFTGESVESFGDMWEVQYRPLSLQLPSAAEGFEDRYEREFTVRGAGEHLVEIRSEATELDPELLPRVPMHETEAQLRDNGEAYLGLPDEPPRITFLEAVDAVLAGGIGSPLLARDIDGTYVDHARDGEEPRPVWVIELRGMPPYPVKGPVGVEAAAAVPEWQRNHMRNIVDARTGQVLFANNLPQPAASIDATERIPGP